MKNSKILNNIKNILNKYILVWVYWIIEILNKNKTSSHKKVEQLGLFKQGIVKGLALKFIKYVKKIVKVVYEILKIEYWPHRYYILLYILFITTFSMDMITFTRIIKFIVILFFLLIFKKVHKCIEIQKFTFLNKKIIILLMWINTFQNPIIYLIWRWDLYIYENFKYFINKYIKNFYINNLLTILFLNLTIPLKFIYLRFYKNLYYYLFVRYS